MNQGRLNSAHMPSRFVIGIVPLVSWKKNHDAGFIQAVPPFFRPSQPQRGWGYSKENRPGGGIWLPTASPARTISERSDCKNNCTTGSSYIIYERGELKAREQKRLFGETRRKHLGIPLLHMKVERSDQNSRQETWTGLRGRTEKAMCMMVGGASSCKAPPLIGYAFSLAALVPANHPDVNAQASAQPPIYMFPCTPPVVSPAT